MCNIQPCSCTGTPIVPAPSSVHIILLSRMLTMLACMVFAPVNVQVHPLHRLRGDQVTLGEDVATGAYGSIRLVKRIDSPLFPASKRYVAKQLIKEHGRNARQSLATEAVNVGAFHPSFVMALGITSTHPHLLIMEYWPHGNLGLYWYVHLPCQRTHCMVHMRLPVQIIRYCSKHTCGCECFFHCAACFVGTISLFAGAPVLRRMPVA